MRSGRTVLSLLVSCRWLVYDKCVARVRVVSDVGRSVVRCGGVDVMSTGGWSVRMSAVRCGSVSVRRQLTTAVTVRLSDGSGNGSMVVMTLCQMCNMSGGQMRNDVSTTMVRRSVGGRVVQTAASGYAVSGWCWCGVGVWCLVVGDLDVGVG